MPTDAQKKLFVFYTNHGAAQPDYIIPGWVEDIALGLLLSTATEMTVHTSNELVLLCIRAAVKEGKFAGVTVMFIDGTDTNIENARRCNVDSEGRMSPIEIPVRSPFRAALNRMLYGVVAK